MDHGNRIDNETLRRWTLRAFLVGFRVGGLAAIAALMN
jgi:hypothetical protein